MQKNSALTMAQGLLAMADIQANIATDPSATADALLDFIKTPIAANNLISPPFDLSQMTAARDTSADVGIPDCLNTMGMPGCDSFTTAGTCDAGGFSFSGTASRMCSPCDNVGGVCNYAFSFPVLHYTVAGIDLSMATWGSAAESASQIAPSMAWNFDLSLQAGTSTQFVHGGLGVCSCGTATIEPGPPPTGKPRKLVNAQFVVKEIVGGSCALVTFDDAGNVSVANSCDCTSGDNQCQIPLMPN